MQKAYLAALLAFCLLLSSGPCRAGVTDQPQVQSALPNVTHSGFLPIDQAANSSLYYAYYEAHQPGRVKDNPVVLWLQGGPGCASMFGNLYELGPFLVNSTLGLQPNPGAWNRAFGLLFIDQPIGTGFSPQGLREIPGDEQEVATDLYAGLQTFFTLHPELRTRPLVITGESYAGKYVPAIGHFILQAQAAATNRRLSSLRAFPPEARRLGGPLFNLVALAIGNGLTDPVSQVLHAADGAFYTGLIDSQQQAMALARQLEVAELVRLERWEEAHKQRSELLAFLKAVSGLGTMEDVRRSKKYDYADNVGRYLNQPAVQEALGLPGPHVFISCSGEVERALGPDVMKSAADLIPDILQQLPLLLYQGLFDGQDGPATQEAWISSIPWPGQEYWQFAPRHLWRPRLHDAAHAASLEAELDHPGLQQGVSEPKAEVAGYWKTAGPLTQVVLRGSGHMVPHDAPLQAQAMLERWVQSVLKGHAHSQPVAS